jgi:hypothetical protein
MRVPARRLFRSGSMDWADLDIAETARRDQRRLAKPAQSLFASERRGAGALSVSACGAAFPAHASALGDLVRRAREGCQRATRAANELVRTSAETPA